MPDSPSEPSDGHALASPRVIIVSGLSGSGKSTSIRALEDMGYFCIDNLPIPLVPKVLELAQAATNPQQQWRHLAFVIDTRDHIHLDQAEALIDQLRDEEVDLEILFLEADEEELVRRFSETRRRHPLSQGDTVRVGLRRERDQLADLRANADLVIDTTQHTVHTLKALLKDHYSGDETPPLTVTILSFGFKHGLPPECDLVFDLRFLPNPYFIDELRPKTGLDEPVQQFVLGLPESSRFLALFGQMTDFVLPMYEREGKSYLTIGIGCTGGKHRSVAMSEAIAQQLQSRQWHINLRHRDVPRYLDDGSPSS